eukprot:CAMPEP_0202958418 /NCGR_PEP_ID=MMETSP1396-20130829/2771_1 /ASSEMBLY_ACC=CAM_ASM_000872 /TAXON_ID= /ORGANISM="Pseudokeronopsis sp., Strain Brazil" /LENGTH=198 /DNA_ID=CAMNT_0049676489 /DNA_START=27 /DNA_END=623 /DNA_ORIENTATION=+
MFEKEVVIDARGHLIGRLACVVAKELLNGQKIVVVRCELLNKSGSLFRNKLKLKEYLNKTRNSNPRRGHIHWRAPSRIFWKAVRGMIPHKTARGMAAMSRLKVFEGIPTPYDHKKRKVVPSALKIVRLKENRKYCVLGDLAELGGWSKKDLMSRLEAKRKTKAAKFWVEKKKKVDARKNASKNKELEPINKDLAQFGF